VTAYLVNRIKVKFLSNLNIFMRFQILNKSLCQISIKINGDLGHLCLNLICQHLYQHLISMLYH
jgi:hypothetical protein